MGRMDWREVRERPILCSADEVRAILAGTLTELRRAIKPTMTPPRVAPLRIERWIIDGAQQEDEHGYPCWVGFHPDYPGEAKWFTCPYGGVGDRLWVRETWLRNAFDDLLYKADREGLENSGMGWRSSICMPRTASRILLENTDVDVDTTSIEWVISFRRVQP